MPAPRFFVFVVCCRSIHYNICVPARKRRRSTWRRLLRLENGWPMGLLEQLQSDQKDAMRARDMTRLTTIRTLRAAITNEEVNRRSRIRSQALQRLAQERGVKL